VVQGPGGPIHLPVNWADHAEISFLRTPEDTRHMLEAAGFQVPQWIDNTDAAIAEAAADRARATPSERSVLGIHLVVGETFRDKMRNSNRNLAENRTRLINAVLLRP
jgi:hypothetical protein